jgi:hypothetical protein
MKSKVRVEVKTYATSVHVFLEEKEIGLWYDGDNLFKATKEINIPDCILDLEFKCDGFNYTDWEINVWLDDAEKPLFKRKGSIMKRGNCSFREYVEIPDCKPE